MDEFDWFAPEEFKSIFASQSQVSSLESESSLKSLTKTKSNSNSDHRAVQSSIGQYKIDQL